MAFAQKRPPRGVTVNELVLSFGFNLVFYPPQQTTDLSIPTPLVAQQFSPPSLVALLYFLGGPFRGLLSLLFT